MNGNFGCRSASPTDPLAIFTHQIDILEDLGSQVARVMRGLIGIFFFIYLFPLLTSGKVRSSMNERQGIRKLPLFCILTNGIQVQVLKYTPPPQSTPGEYGEFSRYLLPKITGQTLTEKITSLADGTCVFYLFTAFS